MLGVAPGPTTRVLGCPVIEGPTPPPWPGAVDTEYFVADHDRALVIHDDASVYVAHGTEVVIDVPPDQRLAYDYLVYSHALRLLLLQRGRFTLHATLVESPAGHAVAVTGPSTVGKTTTAVALAERGWTFVCDDIVGATTGADGVTAQPFPRPLHASDALAQRLGVDPAIGRELPGADKRAYAFPSDTAPRRLAAVLRLDLGDHDHVVTRRQSPLEALPMLAALSDTAELCQLPPYRARFLQWLSELLTQIPVIEVVRPRTGVSVDAVADAVEAVVRDI
jgi:hypothetical protein